jgi:acetolactate synthase-1/3 small subunit
MPTKIGNHPNEGLRPRDRHCDVETAPDVAAVATEPHTVVELEVVNHAGVMSHVVGLFSRRAFNLEGILVMPVGDGARSRIWLRVADQARLEQMIRQVEKLEDVLRVHRHGAGHEVFERIEEFFQ